jgi:hypothetical protein
MKENSSAKWIKISELFEVEATLAQQSNTLNKSFKTVYIHVSLVLKV